MTSRSSSPHLLEPCWIFPATTIHATISSLLCAVTGNVAPDEESVASFAEQVKPT